MQTVFFVVMGAPYESELTTSLFRMIDAALDQQHRVWVWTCGGATTLTMQSLGERKPRNPLDLDAEYPTTGQFVNRMLTRGDGRLEWYICRQCMEERGANEQLAGVKIQPPFRFLRYLDQADVCLVMGVK
jgi:sulfur relay (sulfurtransferase) complex TusBCD TusD component (DsrE family)